VTPSNHFGNILFNLLAPTASGWLELVALAKEAFLRAEILRVRFFLTDHDIHTTPSYVNLAGRGMTGGMDPDSPGYKFGLQLRSKPPVQVCTSLSQTSKGSAPSRQLLTLTTTLSFQGPGHGPKASVFSPPRNRVNSLLLPPNSLPHTCALMRVSKGSGPVVTLPTLSSFLTTSATTNVGAVRVLCRTPS